jgi:hypothetical protein
MMHKPTEKELEFCKDHLLEFGVDEGDEQTPQLYHICYPAETNLGALCGTPDLWGAGVGRDEITCVECVEELSQLMEKRKWQKPWESGYKDDKGQELKFDFVDLIRINYIHEESGYKAWVYSGEPLVSGKNIEETKIAMFRQLILYEAIDFKLHSEIDKYEDETKKHITRSEFNALKEKITKELENVFKNYNLASS